MTWTKLDDGFTDHPKVNGLSHGAFRLHVSGLCHASRTLSDGRVETRWAPRLMPGYKASFVRELVAAGLWDETPGGWEIHDFLHYNPSAAEVKAEREEAAQRMRRLREERKKKGKAPTNGSPERSGEQGGERSGERAPERSVLPGANVRGPRPVPSPTNSPHPLTGPGEAPPRPEEEEDQKVRATCEVLAERSLRARRGDPLANPRAWVAKVAAERYDEHAPAIRCYLYDDPERTPHQLAAMIESGPPKPAPPPACTANCVNGWLETESGDVTPCACNRPKVLR